MAKKTIQIILGCAIISIIPIIILYSTSTKSSERNNGFTRTFNSISVTLYSKMNLKNDHYYLAGFTPYNIYLGNSRKPSYLLKINYEFTDSNHYKLTYPEDVGFLWKYGKLEIDSPRIYFSEGVTSTILLGRFPDLNLKQFSKTSPGFLSIAHISNVTSVLRSKEKNLNLQILIKLTKDRPFIQKETGILKKQVDGIFCTDGMLKYDKMTSQLVYLYYYRNEIICMDTNLNLILNSHTIDTNSHAKIKVVTTKSGESSKLSSPPFRVNIRSCVFDNKLFVQSALKADNETPSRFESNATIDAYSLKDGKYLSSFYIPLEDREELGEFQVINNYIVTLSKRRNTLSTYQLNLNN